jgi:hypothetical protein
MAAFIRFDGIDGAIHDPQTQADTQPNPPSWGLDRIDQRSLPMPQSDPFFAYGDGFSGADGAAAGSGFYMSTRLQIMYVSFDEPHPADGLVAEPDLAAGPFLMHAGFLYG